MGLTRQAGAAALCVLMLTACVERQESEVTEPPKAKTELVIGLIPERNVFRQLERYEPLANYLAEQVGIDIELQILSRYGNIIDNFESAPLDGAFFGSFTYVLAHEKLGVSVIARPVNPDGTSTYFGMILVRQDSNIRTAADMRDKRFAFVDKATTAGYLLPLEFFVEHGISDYTTHFKETYFAGTHEDVVYDVLGGKADIGAAKNTVLSRLIGQDERVGSELIVLAESPHVPENGLALRSDIDPELRQRIKDRLIRMHETPRGQAVLARFGALRFIETTDEDYEPVYRYARHVNLDLASYDYSND